MTEIAKGWAEEPQTKSAEEIFYNLWSAFWRGEFKISAGDDGFLIANSPLDTDTKTEKEYTPLSRSFLFSLLAGEEIFDFTPKYKSTPNSEADEEDYRQLAEWDQRHYNKIPEWISSAYIVSAALKKESLIGWCQLKGISIPSFWSDPENARSLNRKENNRTREDNIFIRKNNFFEIRYENGETIQLVSGKGLEYIQYLIENPGIDCKVQDLYTAVNKLPEEGTAEIFENKEDCVDDLSITKFKEAIKKLDEKIAEAKASNNTVVINEYIKQREECVAYLKKNRNFKGKSKKVRDNFERKTDATCRAIRRAIMQISEHDEKLGQHFQIIKTGIYCSYKPEKTVVWVTR